MTKQLISGVEMIDGVKRNAQHASFDIPSRERVSGLAVGDYCKIGVEWRSKPGVACNGERFWVRITKVGDGGFEGVVNNDLIYSPNHGLECEDHISFEHKHVLSIFHH